MVARRAAPRVLGGRRRPSHLRQPRAGQHAGLAARAALPARTRAPVLPVLREGLEDHHRPPALGRGVRGGGQGQDAPRLRAQRRRSERFTAEYGDSLAADISATIRKESGSSPLPADTRRDLHHGRREVRAASRRTWPPPSAFIHMQYFIWEQDELTAELTAILLDRARGGRRGAHPLRLARLHQLQEGRAQAARPPPAPR